jgi:hypothetical protein
MVISERAPRLSPPPVMPPSMAWWAPSLQLSGLSAQSADRARQFLSRAPQLHPGVRDQMAFRICAEVAAQISPPPPPGAPPQLVLAAVLAERHHRELTRLSQPAPPGPPPWTTPPAAQPGPWPPAYTQPSEPWPASPQVAPPPAQTGGFIPPD